MPSPALNVPSSALIAPLPVNTFPNKIAPKKPDNISPNPLFCPLVSFSIVSPTPFISKPGYSRDLTIFMILISSLEMINAVIRDPNIFL